MGHFSDPWMNYFGMCLDINMILTDFFKLVFRHFSELESVNGWGQGQGNADSHAMWMGQLYQNHVSNKLEADQGNVY